MNRIIAFFAVILFSLLLYRTFRIYYKTKIIGFLLISISLFIWIFTLFIYMYHGESRTTDIFALVGLMIYLTGKLFGIIFEKKDDWEKYIMNRYGTFWLITGNLKDILEEGHEKNKLELFSGKRIYGLIYGILLCLFGYIQVVYFGDYDSIIFYSGYLFIFVGLILFVATFVDYIYIKIIK